MDHILTLILANDPNNFLLYFAEIGQETVLSRNLRLLKDTYSNIVVISDYREQVCPDDYVTIIPTNKCGTLKEVWINIRDYEFRVCRVLYGHVVFSHRMLKSIYQDKRSVGLYGNHQQIFGFILNKNHKCNFLEWSLDEWRKHPFVDLSSMVQFHPGKLSLSTDYSGEYASELEMEAIKDDRKHKRDDVGRTQQRQRYT